MKPITILAGKAFESMFHAYYRTGAKLTIAILVMMPPAHAAVVLKILNKVVDLLTNKYARGASIIAIACLGYKMLGGDIDKRKAMYIMGGIAFVIGAPTIYYQLFR